MSEEWQVVFQALCAKFDGMRSDLDAIEQSLEATVARINGELDELWSTLGAGAGSPSGRRDGESGQEAESRPVEALAHSLGELEGNLARLGERLVALFRKQTRMEVRLHRLVAPPPRPQDTDPTPPSDLHLEVRQLRQEVNRLRRDLEAPVVQLLDEALSGSPEDRALEDDLPASAVPPVPVLGGAARRLEVLAGLLPPAGRQRVAAELEHLRTVLTALEREAEWQERASQVLQLLERRMLAGGSDLAARQRAHDFVQVRLPDLWEDLQDLHRDRDLEPGALARIDREIGGLLEDLGMEEMRPRRGDAFNGAEHSLLRVERASEDGLEGRIATCLRPGLRLRATGETVRKAEVSVFP